MAAPTRNPTTGSTRFVDAGKAAKLDIALSDDISRELWQKFIFLTAMAGSTASLRSPIGPIVADPELRGFFRALMDEAFAVGKAKGVALDPAYLDDRMNFLVNKVEPGMKASMAHDLERGNRLELDWLAGKVRALGREFGIPTPASDTVYTVLKLHRMGKVHAIGFASIFSRMSGLASRREDARSSVAIGGRHAARIYSDHRPGHFACFGFLSPSLATSMKSTAPERMLPRTSAKKMRACDDRAVRENVPMEQRSRLRQEMHGGNEVARLRVWRRRSPGARPGLPCA